MRVAITDHAADRYVERVKPHLSRAEATRELLRLLPQGDYSLERPAWLHEGSEDSDLWLTLCDSIAVPLARDRGLKFTATTVLTRAGHSEEARAARNKQAARRRHLKHAGHHTVSRAEKKANRKKERRTVDVNE